MIRVWKRARNRAVHVASSAFFLGHTGSEQPPRHGCHAFTSHVCQNRLPSSCNDCANSLGLHTSQSTILRQSSLPRKTHSDAFEVDSDLALIAASTCFHTCEGGGQNTKQMGSTREKVIRICCVGGWDSGGSPSIHLLPNCTTRCLESPR